MRWFQKSVGEPIARGSGQITLFVPHGVEGFVSRATGAVSLRTILIRSPRSRARSQPSTPRRVSFAISSSQPVPSPCFMSETRATPPPCDVPDVPGWTWNRMTATGDPADRILHVAADIGADLIVMTTDGPYEFLDGLRGTTSARVLNNARCPVANLPVGARLAT